VGVVDLVDVVVTGWVAAPPPRANTWLALEVNAAAAPRSSAAFDNGVMVVPFVSPEAYRRVETRRVSRSGDPLRSDWDCQRSPAR